MYGAYGPGSCRGVGYDFLLNEMEVSYSIWAPSEHTVGLYTQGASDLRLSYCNARDQKTETP